MNQILKQIQEKMYTPVCQSIKEIQVGDSVYFYPDDAYIFDVIFSNINESYPSGEGFTKGIVLAVLTIRGGYLFLMVERGENYIDKFLIEKHFVKTEDMIALIHSKKLKKEEDNNELRKSIEDKKKEFETN